MAEAVLSALLQVVFEKLASPILEEFGYVKSLKKQMDKLRSTLSIIQAVLEDAEEKQVKDKAVRIWLTKLKDVAYDADNLLTELIAEALRRKVEIRECLRSQVRNFFSPSNSLASRLKSGRKLKDICEKLEIIAEERSNFHLGEGITDRRPEIDKKQTFSSVIESEVYGREEDKEKIVNLLLMSTNKPEDVSVIPIVGIGGLGKTTLAQLAYNDERAKKHFELKLWVCVSDDFDVRRLTKAIIESATKTKCDLLEMDVLQSRLQESLRGRRYLLVLDDVWNEDHDEWEKLKTLLRGGVEGSKIIVTTRSKKVASIMGTTSPYHLEGLSENDCLALFNQRAFSQGEEYPHLIVIGKQIVKKCGGVPLAAKTLGGLMHFKREEMEWLFVEESELWNLCGSENGIFPALRLSYNHLPSHLKPCFTYCSIFPKNYDIKKENLIDLWIAEGLILPSEGSKQLEDIGNDYFNELLWRSFFEDVNKGDDGSIATYKMHDILHDLAQSISGNEFMRLEHGSSPRNPAQARHSSIVYDFGLSTIPDVFYKAKNLRSLLLFPRGDTKEVPTKIFTSFRYLRVLDLSGSGIEVLPASISSLKCLKYLNLSNTYIKTLPETISSLYNLQTLNLMNCYNLVELPSNMRNMTRLKHLNIKGCKIRHMPAGIGQLSHLQTLPMFIVGKESSESIKELQCLNLRGELNIKHLEKVRNVTEAKMAKLREKHHLHMLGLYWESIDEGLNRKNETKATVAKLKEKEHLRAFESSRGHDSDVGLGENVEALMEDLQPHPNLRRLFVNGYAGRRFPYWMRDLILPNLIEIVLINCQRCENLPMLGVLPFLKVLNMQGMDAVKYIGNEFHGGDTRRAFPSLKELSLKHFRTLEEWSSIGSREVFPCLDKLTVNNCPKLTTMPLLPSVQCLELRNCNAMIFRSVTNLTSLSVLVIDAFPELLSLSEGLLQNNSSLKSLTISSCPMLHSLPRELENLIALKSLTIRWCQELSSLPQGLRNLTSLESLEISQCDSLISLSEEGIQGLSSLRSLSIENCNNLTSLPMGMQHLTALEHLTIMYCPNLASLPEGLQHLSALRCLNILNCPELASLPEGLQHITALQNLEIRSCPGLTALPEWVKNLPSLRSLAISDCQNITSLPEGLNCLNALQHLSIRECPSLVERCEKGRGQDWSKIAHIPHIYIGSDGFNQCNREGSSSR